MRLKNVFFSRLSPVIERCGNFFGVRSESDCISFDKWLIRMLKCVAMSVIVFYLGPFFFFPSALCDDEDGLVSGIFVFLFAWLSGTFERGWACVSGLQLWIQSMCLCTCGLQAAVFC